MRIAEAGPADGTPTLLLHGWGGSLYMYRHALERLPMYGIRAIAVDLRGYGLSDKPTTRGAYTLDAYHRRSRRVARWLLELSRPDIIGQSMGGGIALHFSRCGDAERVSRIVLINPSSLVPIRFIPLVRTMPRSLVVALGARLVPRWAIGVTLRRVAYGSASAVTEEDIDEYWSPTQLPGYAAAARGALGDFDWSVVSDEEAQRLAVPTLRRCSAQRSSGAPTAAARPDVCADAEVHVMAGGHCVHEENPAAAYRMIGEFLRRDSIK